MCLAIPGEVIECIDATHALVRFGATEIKINLSFVENVKPGMYVIAHSGFALTVLDEAEAKIELALWDEMNAAAVAEDGENVQ
jgi:hydrogenase expression/formation protein HypC